MFFIRDATFLYLPYQQLLFSYRPHNIYIFFSQTITQCDKAFVIPCWISLLHIVPQSNHLRWLQYTVLLFLILAEVASGCIRFRAYFTSVAVPAPKVEGFDFSTSAVKADHIGKAKQTFEMVGTALFILPWMIHYLGLFFLTLAVPLAYESVRRKIHKRVLYVNASSQNKSNTNLDYTTLKFWMQAKAMGSKLIVGFAEENDDDDSNNKKTDMGKIFNACACSCVDEVIAEAPAKLDLMFLEKQKIDFVVSTAVETQFVTDEVVNAGRCLTIGEDGVVRLFKLKDATKKD
jgi:glycerol-3-phosphate cytidylyltransferase-like family protein